MKVSHCSPGRPLTRLSPPVPLSFPPSRPQTFKVEATHSTSNAARHLARNSSRADGLEQSSSKLSAEGPQFKFRTLATNPRPVCIAIDRSIGGWLLSALCKPPPDLRIVDAVTIEPNTSTERFAKRTSREVWTGTSNCCSPSADDKCPPCFNCLLPAFSCGQVKDSNGT